jgi:hypothetical protein
MSYDPCQAAKTCQSGNGKARAKKAGQQEIPWAYKKAEKAACENK